jgi:integrase/recombinase XerC
MTAGRDEIERWLDSCDLIPDSRKHYVHVLSGFYRWAVEEGMITSNPTARVATARRKRRLPRPIPPSQLEPAVAAATDPRMRAWLLLGCLAGLRCCEIAGLGGEDIGEHSIFVANGKGGHQREIPLHPRLRDALDAFGAPERGVVFPIKDTWPRPETVSSYISNHLRKFGVEKGPHRLRHSFGSSLYQTTKDIRLTQELMGHNSIETTMLYTQVDAADADAVDAVRALNLGGGR